VGFLQVGPQYYPPRVNGAQIIERGPHGARFAAGPQRQPDGTFRWWSEQMSNAGDYKGYWQPQQRVLGVMGLGNPLTTFTDWLADKFVDSGVVSARGGPSLVFDPRENRTVGVADPFTKAALTQAVRSFSMEAQRGRYSNPQLRGGLEQVRASLMNAGRWTDSGVAPNGQQYVPSPTLMAELERTQIAMMQASGERREDGAPVFGAGVIDPRTGRARIDDPDEAARRELRRAIPEAFSPPALASGAQSMLTKALMIGAVGLVLYGVAQGVGYGVSRRK